MTGCLLSITTTLGKSIKLGGLITLRSHLEGFDNCHDVVFIWSVDKGTGVYEVVEGASDVSYTFPPSVESLRRNWRLSVYYR